ncbi:MAG: divergent polysaccharide deacetylase family protein [Treponema sp.]|nr:divergent polysaccharide deacetylase family protein [Treponema sp.]
MKKTIKGKRSGRKRKKTGFSVGLQSFLLVGLIVAFALGISFAGIYIYQSLNKRAELPPVTADSEPVPETIVNITPNPADNPAEKPAEKPIEKPVVTPHPNTTPSRPAVPDNTKPVITNAVTTKPAENMGSLIFVIDDAGNNLRELEPFLRIPGPVTIAVLPGLPYSAEAAKRIRAAGKEVLLHQPMEAIGAQNPGPGAIVSGMSAGEILEVLTRNIAEVGPVAGINNHQGSRITMDREAMQTILDFCAQNNLFFLDSRTTADTVVPSVANQMGIKIAQRDVFIDNEQNKNAMIRYISGGLLRAQRNGSAVMIGHTWSPALAPLLTEQFPLYIEQGYTLKTVSDIIK